MLTRVEATEGPAAAAALASRPSSRGISPLGAACAYGGAPELAAATVHLTPLLSTANSTLYPLYM
jgi:hypothetical protein